MPKKIQVTPMNEILLKSRNQEIFDYLKDNLRISVSNSTNTAFNAGYGDPTYIEVHTKVELFLNNPETNEEVLISDSETTDSFNLG